MDFELTDEQVELQRVVHDLVDRDCPPSLVRAVVEGDDRSGEMWKTLVQGEWTGLTVPVEHGGSGASAVELVIVLDELGRGADPSPFLATTTQFVPLVAEAGMAAGPDLFAPRALSLVTRASAGLTRRINILCDKALLAAFTESAHSVADRHVRAAIADSEFAAVARSRRPALYAAAALAAGIALGAALPWWFLSGKPIEKKIDKPAEAPPPAPPAPSPSPVVAAVVPPAPQPPPSLLSEAQASRFAGYSAGNQPLLAARLSASRELLGRAPDESYTIELFNTSNSDPARMERFLLRARGLVRLEDIAVIPMAAGGQYRLRVVYGQFDSREAASEAGKRLPPRYQEAFQPATRSFAELRGQI